VVDEAGCALGSVTEAGCADVDCFARLSEVLERLVPTVPLDTPPREVYEQLHQRGEKLALGVDDNGRLAGVLTQVGALRSGIYTPAVDDNGRLRIGAAIGLNGDVAAKAAAVPDAGGHALVVDTP